MIRRPRRSVPASLAALILLAAAVLTAISTIEILTGHPPLLPFAAMAGIGAGLVFDQPPLLAISAAVAAVGLVLLWAALSPGRPTVLPLATGAPDGPDTGATRASLTRALHRAAADVDGVDRARVRLRRRKLTATVHTSLHRGDGLAEQVRAALDRRLDDTAPTRRPRIRVRVATTKE